MKQHANWSERLKWAEDMGLKNLQEKATSADSILKAAQTTLTYVLAGMGGTFAYVLPGLERKLDTLLFGAIVLCGYFGVCGIYLVVTTFFVSDYPSPYQEAKNLLRDPERSIDEIRLEEIDSMTERLDDSLAWIVQRAAAINRTRVALVLSPVAFIVACLLFRSFG